MPDTNVNELRSKLQAHRQEHVLRYWDELNDSQRSQLVDQIEDLDLDQLDELIADSDEKPDFEAMAGRAEPPAAVDADGGGVTWAIADAIAAGEEALRGGKLAALLVAGGQGTRLGFDQPKGMYPIGPVSDRTLFQIFADRLRAVSQRYETTVPLYIMTSQATDQATRDYFAQHDHLGLPADSVHIFQQGTMPAVDDQTGKLLLAQKDSLALSPDGHGGTVKALLRSGSLDAIKADGIEQLFYFQVDNPLIQLMDPAFIGHHLLAKSELTSQVIRKRYPTERVGNVATVDGRLQIIEYSDLPESVASLTQPDGSLRLWAGSIAVHVIDVDFLDRVSASPSALPFHRAHKKVPHLNEQGDRVEPDQPNAIKFEKFIFDLLPAAKNGIVVEVRPEQAFAPVKNAEGAENDTASLAKQAISDLHRSWLEKAGATVNPNAVVEISSQFALDAGQVEERIQPGLRVSENRFFD